MKKLAALFLIVVMALAVMGFSFAKWSDNVTVTANAKTRYFKFGFVPRSFLQMDVGPDWTGDDILSNPRLVPEGKNVGSTTANFYDSNCDSYLDTLTVTVNNAYPGYYNEISAKVQNYGTIPVVGGWAKIKSWTGATKILEDKVVYAFHKDGSITEYDGLPDTEVFQFCWLNNTYISLNSGKKMKASFLIYILQPADQLETYTFEISFEAAQCKH